jgi:spermidine synthase
MLHVGLLLVSLISLPIALPRGWDPPASGNVIPWLLGVLTISVGIPFFMLAATAPLVQHWLAERTTKNPYVLYAASNAGSFLGLLAFPFLLEPNLRLGEQARYWSIGYVAVVAVLIGCAVTAVTGYRQPVAGHPPLSRTPPPATRRRLTWIALAFVPSSLLLGITTYITTDVAATPLFWVVPLAIYLLTFVIVFARPDRQPNRWILLLHAVTVIALFTILSWKGGLGLRFTYAFHLGLFALTALTLHGRLAALRPSPEHLTEFYLWLALGGALGGAFNAIAAPILFKSIVEYQWMIVLACFLRPTIEWLRPRVIESSRTFPTALVPAMLLALVLGYDAQGQRVLSTPVMWAVSVAAGLVALSLHAYPLRFGISIALLALMAKLYQPDRQVIFADRSFFGAYRVERFSARGHTLYHGTTIHGAQFLDARSLMPLTYYHRRSPLAQVFAALSSRLHSARIGVVGLGTGTILCYSEPGQSWTYFEIDPHIEAIARNPRFFTYLRDCAVRPRIVLGDARLTLAREAPGSYSLIILDAFSSDAIPAHLLTREALELYTRLLNDHGVLLVHISNRTLRLAPVVAATARAAHLYALLGENDVVSMRPNDREFSSEWVAIARRPEDLGSLVSDRLWRGLNPSRGTNAWTDDYWNLFRAIKW